MRSTKLIPALTLAIGAAASVALSSPARAADKVTYQDHILPIFRNACLNCHNASDNKAGLDLSTYQKTMQGSSGGEVLYAGELIDSILYQVVMHNEQPKMPPNGQKLPDDQLNLIKQWIEGGLLESSGSKAVETKKKGVAALALDKVSLGKPDGPPPMPVHLLREPAVHTDKPGAVTSMAASPWAPLIAIAAQKQVLLYNSDTSELEGTLHYPDGWPKTVRFSRNGKLLIAGGGHHAKRGEVVVWNVETGERVMTVGDEYDEALAADLSADQRVIAIGGPSKLVKLYDTASGQPFATIKKHTDWVMSLAFSPDGVLLATGGRSGDLFIWEAQTGREFYTLGGHRGAITDMAWRVDSNILATAGEDGRIILWDMHNGNAVKNWEAHKGGVLAVDFSRDGHIVSAGRDNHMRVWDGNGTQKRNYNKMDDIVMACAFTHDGQRVINADWRGNVRMYDRESGKELPSPTSNPPTIEMRLSTLVPARDDLRAKRDAAANAAADAKAVADASAAKVAAMQPGVDQAKAAVVAAEQEIATAKQAVAKLTAELVETQANRAKHEAVLAGAEQAVAQARGAVEAVAIQQATSAKAEAETKTAFDTAKQQAEQSAQAAAAQPEDAALAEAAAGALKAQEEAAAAHAAAIEAATKDRQMLEAVRNNLTQSITKQTNTRATIDAIDKTIDEQRAKLSSANATVASAEQNHLALTGKLAEASSANAQPKAKAADDARAFALAQQVLAAAEQKFAGADRDVRFWEAQRINVVRHARRGALATAQAEADGAAAQSAYLAGLHDQANAALAAARHELAEQPKVVAAREEALGVAIDKVKAAEQDVASAKEHLAQRQALRDTLGDAANKVAQAGNAEGSSDAVKQAMAKAAEAVALMQQEVAAQEAATNKQLALLNEAMSQVPAAEKAVAEAKARLAALPQTVAEHEAKVADAATKAKAAHEAFAAAKANAANAQQAFDQVHASFIAALPADAK